mgnify:CR=1 FL=1
MLALAAVSCEQAKFGIDEPVSDNMLKVRFATPELEVKSGSEDVSFYAYLTSELKAGTIAPIAATMQKEDGYLYYNIPEGTTDVIFSNIGNSDQDVYITAEDGRVVFKTRDEHSAHINTEIFYAELSGITTGTSTAYSIPVRRLTSIVHSELHYIDNDGNQISTHNIDYVNVFYHGWATSLTQNEDGTFTGKSYSMGSGFGSSHAINATDETGRVFIPGELVPDVQVEIQFTNGTNKRYRTSLGKVFEQNHRYNVLLRLRQLNVEGTFVLEEPSVSTVSRNPNYSKQDFFTLSEGRTVGGYADDVLTIDVSTALPYDWYISYPEEANSFFDIQVIDGQIVIRALATNENDIRSVDIEILTNEGYSKTITVNQKSSLKHRIVMTSETDYRNYWITLSGENVTVTDAAGNTKTESGSFTNLRFDFTNPSIGSQVVIEGDIITYMDGLGWTDQDARYHYDFENCTYLEEIRLRTDSETLDLTGLPSLKTVNTVNSRYKNVLLDENQGITYFRCQNNDDITDLNLRNIAQSIETIDCSDCNSLIRNIFTNFTNLKTINIDNCTSSSVINLTGCSSLEEFSVNNNKASTILLTNCASLKTMTLKSMNLTSGISHEGAEAITTINTENTTISTFNFAGKASLETVGAMNSSSFDVNGCSALSSLGKISDVSTLNISNCSALTSIEISLNRYSTQTLSFDNCPALEDVTLNNINMQHDFSPLYSLKKIQLNDICGSENTIVDLSGNNMLTSAYIGGYSNTSECKINSLLLPQSTEELDLYRLYHITDLNLSGYPNLKRLMMHDLYKLNNLNLTYCTALETLDMRYCFYDYSYNIPRSIDLTGCTSLKSINKNIDNSYCYYLNSINLTDCYNLESCNLYDSNLMSIDFSYCSRLNQFDLRYNELDADGITALIESLPDWSVIDDGWNSGAFRLSGNPGYNGYDFTYANQKYWYEIAN